MVESSTVLPMTTSIKVRDITKSKLDTLQSKFAFCTGEKISFQCLIDKISDYALLHEDDLIKKLPALEDDPAWRDPVDWGVVTDASKVDEYLYE